MNCFLALASFLTTSLLIEGALRVNHRHFSSGYVPSENAKIVYELLPGYHLRSLNAKISSQGLNDREFSLNKPKGVTRIAVVGDSSSFGWVVGQAAGFPKVLERRLNTGADHPFEVLNFSVPGYNTSQESELIRRKVVSFSPDIVILFFCGNDVHICNYFQPEINPWNFLYHRSLFCHWALRNLSIKINKLDGSNPFEKWLKRSFLDLKKGVLGMYYPEQEIYSYPGLEETIYLNGNPPAKPELVPLKYRYMLGYDNYRKHLMDIAGFLKENKIELISTGFLEPNAKTIHAELGLPYVDLYDRILIDGLRYDTMRLFEKEGHLNIEGHEWVAQELHHFLRQFLSLA